MPPSRLHRFPSIATVDDTIYVVANHYPIEGTAAGPRPIYLARIPGGPMSAPSGDFQFVFPKVVASKTGQVHLIWAEYRPSRPDLLNWGDPGATSIWHSVFVRNNWSKPEEIFSGKWLEWPKDSWNVAVDDLGAPHVVVWTFDDDRSGFVHLAGTSQGWRTNRTPYAPVIPKTAISAKGGSIRIAFVGASSGPSDTTGITVATSSDGGGTWTSTVVHRLGGRRADQLQFVINRDQLHLVWAESPARGVDRDTLRVVRINGSLRATHFAAVALQPGTSTVTATAACGNIVFLAETFSRQPQTFEGTVAADGSVKLRSLRPPRELAFGSGIAGTRQAVVAVLAIQQDTNARWRSVLTSRAACATSRER